MSETFEQVAPVVVATTAAAGGVFFGGTILGTGCFVGAFTVMSKVAADFTMQYFKGRQKPKEGRPGRRVAMVILAGASTWAAVTAGYAARVAYGMAASTPTLVDAVVVAGSFFCASSAVLNALASVVAAASVGESA
jgi:hypothetical protein